MDIVLPNVWEYMTTLFEPNLSENEFVKLMNIYGKQGWELVGEINGRLTFKRRKNN